MNGKTCKLEKDSNAKTALFLEDFFGGFKQLQSRQKENEENRPRITYPKVKRNRHAALSFEQKKEVDTLTAEIVDTYNSDLTEVKTWYVILQLNRLAQDIQSCDLPSDEEKNAVLVKLTQDYADAKLQENISWLRKILDIALYSKQSGFGNCQEKAFFGFAALLLELSKPSSSINSLRLATFNNHFIIIVNEQFLMDPWLNLAFPLDEKSYMNNINKVFKGFGKLVDYFSINKESGCFTHTVVEGATTQEDHISNADLQSCIAFLNQNTRYFTPPMPEKENKNPKKMSRAEYEILGEKSVVASPKMPRHQKPTVPLQNLGFLHPVSAEPDLELEGKNMTPTAQ